VPCHSYSTEFLIRELSESKIILPQSQQLQCPPGGKTSVVGIDGTCVILDFLSFPWCNKKNAFLEDRAFVSGGMSCHALRQVLVSE